MSTADLTPRFRPDRLRESREAKRWTQRALADAAGVSAGMVGLLETGARTPSLDLAGRLAEALGVSALWLSGLPDEAALFGPGVAAALQELREADNALHLTDLEILRLVFDPAVGADPDHLEQAIYNMRRSTGHDPFTGKPIPRGTVVVSVVPKSGVPGEGLILYVPVGGLSRALREAGIHHIVVAEKEARDISALKRRSVGHRPGLPNDDEGGRC